MSDLDKRLERLELAAGLGDDGVTRRIEAWRVVVGDEELVADAQGHKYMRRDVERAAPKAGTMRVVETIVSTREQVWP